MKVLWGRQMGEEWFCHHIWVHSLHNVVCSCSRSALFLCNGGCLDVLGRVRLKLCHVHWWEFDSCCCYTILMFRWGYISSLIPPQNVFG